MLRECYTPLDRIDRFFSPDHPSLRIPRPSPLERGCGGHAGVIRGRKPSHLCEIGAKLELSSIPSRRGPPGSGRTGTPLFPRHLPFKTSPHSRCYGATNLGPLEGTVIRVPQ